MKEVLIAVIALIIMAGFGVISRDDNLDESLERYVKGPRDENDDARAMWEQD